MKVKEFSKLELSYQSTDELAMIINKIVNAFFREREPLSTVCKNYTSSQIVCTPSHVKATGQPVKQEVIMWD